MISTNNYFREFKKVNYASLTTALKRGHDYLVKVTKNGKDWKTYESNPLIQDSIDSYLELLNTHLGKKPVTKRAVSTRTKTPKKAATVKKAVAPVTKRAPAKRKPKKVVDRIIGKTKSGKNIYEKFYHPKHKNFTQIDHLDASNVQMTTKLSTLSDAQRDKESEAHFRKYDRMANAYKPSRRAKPKRKPARAKKVAPKYTGKYVERISEEITFIGRFAALHNKVKNQNQIRLFLKRLQDAINEKRIRKESIYATEINEIQDALILLMTKLKRRETVKVEIGEEKRVHYLTIAGKQRLLSSVRFIKSYIRLQGRRIETPVAKQLQTRIDTAITKKTLTSRDPYWAQVQVIQQTLVAFIKRNPISGTISVSSRELNGLNGIVDEAEGESSFRGLTGLGNIEDDTIVRGSEIAQMDFPTIGFRGKWLNFIGDPNKGFTAMVFGKPKFGKSILCIDFADYLSKNHGEVLYVSREEYNSGTLQQKVFSSGAYEVNFSNKIPADLSPYQFVFLDSITMLGLSTDDLEDLREEYPEISFVFIFQTTKQGAFRGSNQYQHNVDIVIEIPEIGRAVQYGRFNQGGEMDIFNT
jgi:hypothetical protein